MIMDWLVIGTWLLALATFGLVLVTLWSTRRHLKRMDHQLMIAGEGLKTSLMQSELSRMQFEAMQKDRERGAILDVLKYAVIPILSQLENLRKEGGISRLIIVTDESRRIAWGHLRRRFSDYFRLLLNFNGEVGQWEGATTVEEKLDLAGKIQKRVRELIDMFRELKVKLMADHGISVDELGPIIEFR